MNTRNDWKPDSSPLSSPGAAPEPLLFTVDHKPIPLEPEGESVAERHKRRPPKRSFASTRSARWVGAGALTVVVALVAWFTAARPGSAPAAPPMGKISIETRPAGASVTIDGQPRGLTPLVASLGAGRHRVEVSAGTEIKDIPITLAAGEQVSQYLEFQAAPQTGRLLVDSEPQGARVMVDGQPYGVAPIVLDNLRPGPHAVTLQSDVGSVERQVIVEAGGTSSVVVPLIPKGAPLSGWLTVSAPFELQILEGGRLIGTTASERLMVAAGRHEIEIVNETLAYRATRTVNVPPGKIVALPIDLPLGVLHLNASPWAEVWIDGKKVGETPIGNLSVPIGPHEVVFRNPQFGEQRHAVTVTLAAPARLSVNLRR
jgi:hypothetical protein